MAVDKKRAKDLRRKLDARVIAVVKPENMSLYEYKIACNFNGVDPTVSSGPYLHWLMTAEGETLEQEQKVHNMLVHALEAGYLLDVEDDVQCSYFIDGLKSIICTLKWDFPKQILEAVLLNYKGTEVWKVAKRFNKIFGITSVEYFDNDPLEAIKAYVKR